MTMPNERSRAVLGAAEVLKELLRLPICPEYFEYVDDAEAIKQGLKSS